MNKNTAISLLVFVGLGVGAFLALRAPEKGERRGPSQGPAGVQAVGKDTVDELEVTNGKDKTTLKKEGGKWMVSAPVHYPADAEAIKGAVDKLAELSWGMVVTEQKEKAKELEVDDEKGTRVVAKASGKQLFDLYFGKSVGSNVMARPANSNEIWQVGGIQKWAFAKDTKAWRDKVVTEFKRDELESVTVETAGKGKVTVKRTPPDKEKNSPEKIEIAESTLKIDKPDDSVPQGIVSTIYSLRAADFVDDPKPEQTGLGAPEYTITAKAGGKTHTILVGKASGENFHVKLADNAQVFLLPKYTVERLAKAPIEFRDKTLTDIAADNITAIEIAHGGAQIALAKSGADWKATKPVITVDSAKVVPIASGFAGWKATSFAPATDAKTTGLGKPTAKITVHTKDKKTTTILIGAQKGDDYFIQVAGRPDVLLTKKYAVEKFLKKPDDLKKSAEPAKKS